MTFELFEDKGARVTRSQYEYKYREHYRDVSERMTQNTDRNIGRNEMYRHTKTHSNKLGNNLTILNLRNEKYTSFYKT